MTTHTVVNAPPSTPTNPLTPTDPQSNVFTLGTLSFQALRDRIIIKEDEFKSGYECITCNGTGENNCSNCGGIGYHERPDVGKVKCSHCLKGVVRCPSCAGKGGLLVAPEVSQRRPTSGSIVSAGPDCRLTVGQSVMYSNFAGYVVDLDRAGSKVTLRILHESEVLCLLEGQLELKSLRGKTEIATYAP